MTKSALHILEIAKDIRMIELQVVQHRDVRRVVDKLAALVEKRAVVFIPLDHERIGHRTQMITRGRIKRHAADQIAGVASLRAQQMRRQRRSRGFAMRAGNHDIATLFQHMIRQKRGQRNKVQRARFEQPFALPITTRSGASFASRSAS